MLSYRLRVEAEKSHSALPGNTFVSEEVDFDISIVEAIVYPVGPWPDQILILGQRPDGIH